jgi:hypothetical protein
MWYYKLFIKVFPANETVSVYIVFSEISELGIKINQTFKTASAHENIDISAKTQDLLCRVAKAEKNTAEIKT